MASSKLSAKAARLDFSKLPGGLALPETAAAASDAVARPKTAPGAMMAFANDARSELVRENEALRQRVAETETLRGQLDDALGDLRQWEGAKAARLIDAALIQPSRYANRHDLNYGGADFMALRAEIEQAGGNVQPIKVRSVAGSSDVPQRYEVVFGHRRHRACLELGLPVLAVIDNLDDKALFVEMDRENRARKDLSAWEQGMTYRRALQMGLFSSNRKLAEAIGVDLSALGKALALAELPEDLIQAFRSPLELQFRWAKPLADALHRNRDGVLAEAKRLRSAGGDRKPKRVFEQLIAVAEEGGVERFHPPEPIPLMLDGQAVGYLSRGPRQALTISIAAGWVPDERLPALTQLLDNFLREH